jgi:hypothetical protein
MEAHHATNLRLKQLQTQNPGTAPKKRGISRRLTNFRQLRKSKLVNSHTSALLLRIKKAAAEATAQESNCN